MNKKTIIKLALACGVFALAAVLYFRASFTGDAAGSLAPEVQQAVKQAKQQIQNEPPPSAPDPNDRPFAPSARPTPPSAR